MGQWLKSLNPKLVDLVFTHGNDAVIPIAEHDAVMWRRLSFVDPKMLSL